MIKNLLILFFILVGHLTLEGQVDVGNPGIGNVEVDTAFYEADSVSQIRRNGLFSIFKGKPGKAAFYGLIIPGGGQAYNRRYWKIPLALAIDGYVIFNLVDNTRKFNEWNDGLIAMNNEEISSFMGLSSSSQVKTVRDGYRTRKEYGILIAIGGHVLTIVEAFVDRHLIDFDISDDLSFGFQYGQSSESMAMGVFYNW